MGVDERGDDELVSTRRGRGLVFCMGGGKSERIVVGIWDLICRSRGDAFLDGIKKERQGNEHRGDCDVSKRQTLTRLRSAVDASAAAPPLPKFQLLDPAF